MSLMMVWKRPPSALHSFSITASIFPAPGGDRTHSLGRLGCARDRAGSPREQFHTRSLSSKQDRAPEVDCSLPKIITIISKAKPLRRVMCLHAALGSWP